MRYHHRLGAIQAVGVALDVVAGGFAGAEGTDKLALDAGYNGVEAAPGLRA